MVSPSPRNIVQSLRKNVVRSGLKGRPRLKFEGPAWAGPSFLLVLFYQGYQAIEAFVSASLLSIFGPMLFASEQSRLFSKACLVYYVKTPARTVPWLNCFASANSLLLANGFSHLFDLFTIGLVSACAYHGALECRSELREANRK